jgi:tetratricopeptide (TPR) repeat protein
MDAENPVVKLCVAGMQAEANGRYADACALFLSAWEARRDDYDACIAAHYVARHQEQPDDTLHWNQVALDHAERVGDERVCDFYPSLYLNLGRAHELVGALDEARRYYTLAAVAAEQLSDDRYGRVVHGALASAQERLG